ncbi:MAG TPA: hypothetical protein VE684_14860 [Crenalkalicoccus sp.]|jgi:hypothetical protein|nr:hypothetical protein [Crenalkalicoccus sp.]
MLLRVVLLLATLGLAACQDQSPPPQSVAPPPSGAVGTGVPESIQGVPLQSPTRRSPGGG